MFPLSSQCRCLKVYALTQLNIGSAHYAGGCNRPEEVYCGNYTELLDTSARDIIEGLVLWDAPGSVVFQNATLGTSAGFLDKALGVGSAWLKNVSAAASYIRFCRYMCRLQQAHSVSWCDMLSACPNRFVLNDRHCTIVTWYSKYRVNVHDSTHMIPACTGKVLKQ